MSLTVDGYKSVVKKAGQFHYKLVQKQSLSEPTLSWMEQNNKEYSPATLQKFGIHEGLLQEFDAKIGSSRRALISADPSILIPVGPILRCYRIKRPKEDRWRVVPSGYGAQWLGDLSLPELIICEGEWDCFRLHDQGFDNAITHTAGAMTWLPGWTPLFQNKRVWVCYDRDPVGQRGMAKVAKMLFPVSKEVRLVDLPLPGTPDAKDVSDYFRLGGTADVFGRVIEKARYYIPGIS